MKGFMCLFVLLVSLFCFAAAKPKPQGSAPNVQLIRYKNEAEANGIIQGIIAQFEQLGGTSEFHNFQTPYVQPNQVRVFQK